MKITRTKFKCLLLRAKYSYWRRKFQTSNKMLSQLPNRWLLNIKQRSHAFCSISCRCLSTITLCTTLQMDRRHLLLLKSTRSSSMCQYRCSLQGFPFSTWCCVTRQQPPHLLTLRGHTSIISSCWLRCPRAALTTFTRQIIHESLESYKHSIEMLVVALH